ncbi:hypothetical protein [Limosilactobacillus mucosae]|uniref:Uncharacterized protein n=1 Tax=Limosilactobacillus mucosae TaxID=97478 RepID=A0AAJ1HRS1_LIMMU|nr:hypothetical protein [Limosilactobacillus mucosae]MDC2828515.1 hypothetical protein [Limosilactobacillus mucosae]MDC2834527.1 hypothetical protein [Limosilactobacillus mucosae]
MTNKLFNKVAELKAKVSVKFAQSGLAIVVATVASKLMTARVMADNISDTFVDSTGGTDTFANVFQGFVGPMTNIAGVILVLSAIVCGMKIGTAAMTGDSRSRTESIIGLFFIIVAAVVVVHANQIVGMGNTIQINTGAKQ